MIAYAIELSLAGVAYLGRLDPEGDELQVEIAMLSIHYKQLIPR